MNTAGMDPALQEGVSSCQHLLLQVDKRTQHVWEQITTVLYFHFTHHSAADVSTSCGHRGMKLLQGKEMPLEARQPVRSVCHIGRVLHLDHPLVQVAQHGVL